MDLFIMAWLSLIGLWVSIGAFVVLAALGIWLWRERRE
jgi:membrane protein implicated in regulation of membrane protease activity